MEKFLPKQKKKKVAEKDSLYVDQLDLHHLFFFFFVGWKTFAYHITENQILILTIIIHLYIYIYIYIYRMCV